MKEENRGWGGGGGGPPPKKGSLGGLAPIGFDWFGRGEVRTDGSRELANGEVLWVLEQINFNQIAHYLQL